MKIGSSEHRRAQAGRYRFRCRRCEASYETKGFLARHMQLHSEDVRSRSRKATGSSSVRSAGYYHHARNEELFSCTDCGKSFSQKINLSHHMRIHSGKRPFVCKDCDAAFSQEINLISHVRVHSGERPYSCRVCRAAFKQQSALDNHLRRHTGERPYLCNLCGNNYIQKSNLDSHMLKHGVFSPPSSQQCRSRAGTRRAFL